MERGFLALDKRLPRYKATYRHIVGRKTLRALCHPAGTRWVKFANGQVWANNTQHATACGNGTVKRA